MAEPPHSPVTEGVRSLEVRWIFPGQLPPAVARWFSRFPATTESRQDTYLLDPQMRGLSVKVRAGGALEVKVYRGSPGILQVPARARGRLEAWQKWSFPCSPLRQDSADPAGWQPVRKRRRISRFSPASRPAAAPAPVLGGEPRCEVELTEVRADGQDWWTLGFEATGPADLLHSELQATAALVFAQPLPGSAEPRPDYSRSYAEWLGRPPGAESDADTLRPALARGGITAAGRIAAGRLELRVHRATKYNRSAGRVGDAEPDDLSAAIHEAPPRPT